MWNKTITMVGVVITFDVAYLVIKSLYSRFSNSFTLLMFGEKFICSAKECKDNLCSLHNVDAIAECLQTAKYSLDVCMYMLSNKVLCSNVLAAHNRGVSVRIICDTSCGLNLNLLGMQRAGINVKWNDPSKPYLMHHKFCIIDGRSLPENSWFNKMLDSVLPPRKQSKILTGSLNWTQNAVEGNYENIFISNDPVLVEQYQKLFNGIFKEFSV